MIRERSKYLCSQSSHCRAGLDDAALVLVVAHAQVLHQLRQRQALQLLAHGATARVPPAEVVHLTRDTFQEGAGINQKNFIPYKVCKVWCVS